MSVAQNPATGDSMKVATRLAIFLLFFCLCLSPATGHAQADSAAASAVTLLPGLGNQVEFWKKIFTEYSLSQLIFFDPLDMSRIYEVLEVGEDSRPQSYIDGERERIASIVGVDVERVQAQRGIKEAHVRRAETVGPLHAAH